MVRGYKVLSFLALNEHGVPPHWHWYNDIPENIEENNVENVRGFAKELIKAIDLESPSES